MAFYKMQGVESDCLTAQDQFGLDVTALIFALYRAGMGLGFDAGQATELARRLSSRVVEPLRAARIALKSTPAFVNPEAAETLRQTVKAAELAAERLTLEALALLPETGQAIPSEQALRAVADASQARADNRLDALLKRLALAAQNV